MSSKATVVVTGISGNLGLRLLPLLSDFQIVGVDLAPPQASHQLQFVRMDFAVEESTREFMELLRETRPFAVLHLAFVIDPVRTGVLQLERMWQINVAGTARIMEAITEVNRHEPVVTKFVFPSSVSVYGPNYAEAASEESPFGAHTLPYAIHKMESDKVVQQRAPALSGCSVYMLRPHIFAGATVENYLIGAFRGTPNGRSERAQRMRDAGKRLPVMLPYGSKYLDNKIQFVHVDDMARLLAYIVRKPDPEPQRLTILNVAGRGEPMTFAECIRLAHSKLIRVPGKWVFRTMLKLLWALRISAIPPAAMPYMTGQYIMNTDRLQKFLGPDYESVIRYTIRDAFTDCFSDPASAAVDEPQSAVAH